MRNKCKTQSKRSKIISSTRCRNSRSKLLFSLTKDMELDGLLLLNTIKYALLIYCKRSIWAARNWLKDVESKILLSSMNRLGRRYKSIWTKIIRLLECKDLNKLKSPSIVFLTNYDFSYLKNKTTAWLLTC